ncbi:serine/threonine-protein phosphatase 7 isoform X1 [Selaginella moellendorffii]|uniref:serine/threonine-protein phosphatase 7 isoform X1 n=1 Tax=Selaginella moellendorffii TaxID=88036 RepID=UPI000D1C7B24|nr:serine/threonine-protein phosphatase 7 isoform X1 [Selaginella moellendorffii]|eukprot:XP_024517518.1 serine/threonine-protein phosphatase 7 isoform X1 [Selaginella moellendorffii]
MAGEEEEEAVRKVVEWPEDGGLTREWVIGVGETLAEAASMLRPQALRQVVPVGVADSLIARASKIMHKEPNCLRLEPPRSSSSSIVLVGDLHGQLHDLLHLFDLAGLPDEERMFVFNGDYVDRGAWGFETYFLLLAWKVLLPHRVFLLRGNHETKFCTSVYGFEKEISVKFGEHSKHVYRKLLGCFEGHPLAAVIAGKVFMAHGGLFRSLELGPSTRSFLVRAAAKLKLGDLDDLAKSRRGVLDPSAVGNNVIPGDILWSDPSPNPGLASNEGRGIGLVFGPDCTQEFMDKHKLKLIVRSHEGPDARQKRPEMASMDKGYTIDHVVKAGKLITLFSAPDYPQFQATETRFNNKAAYIVLEPPDFCEPDIRVFEAVLPRPHVSNFVLILPSTALVAFPQVMPYYDHVNVMDSDDELDLPKDG